MQLEFNEDGSARDPAALRALIRADPEKLKAVEGDEEVAQAVLGGDDEALQALLRTIFQVRVSESQQGAEGSSSFIRTR